VLTASSKVLGNLGVVHNLWTAARNQRGVQYLPLSDERSIYHYPKRDRPLVMPNELLM